MQISQQPLSFLFHRFWQFHRTGETPIFTETNIVYHQWSIDSVYCNICLIYNGVTNLKAGESMIPFKYTTFASERAMDLYIDFLNIPDNRLSFEVPNDFIVTSDMMETMILAVYHSKGEGLSITS